MHRRVAHCAAAAAAQGYSSTAFALALPEGGTVLTCERSEEALAAARDTWAAAGVTHKARAAAAQRF